MCVKLKIKLKSLAEESRIIRKEELKRKGKWSYQVGTLHEHRVHYLRPIIRATHLAYGCLKGKEYHEIENSPKTTPDWDKVKAMVSKYGNSDDMKRLKEWMYGDSLKVA